VERIFNFLLGILNVVLELLLDVLRFALYGIMTLPLLLTDIVGDTIDIMAGISEIPAGEAIAGYDIYWGAPNIDYDGYICIDLERLFIDEEVGNHKLHQGRYYNTHEATIWAIDMYDYSRPFNDFGDDQFNRMENLWYSVPGHFRNGRNVRGDFIQRYADAAYTADPYASKVYDLKTGRLITPVAYSIEGETYYYIPGKNEQESKFWRYLTPHEAVMAHLEKEMFFLPETPFIWMPTDANIIDGERASHRSVRNDYTEMKGRQDRYDDLGASVWLLSAADCHTIRQRVRYRPTENMQLQYRFIERGDRRLDSAWLTRMRNAQFDSANRMNQIMRDRGYSDFNNNAAGANQYANYKYWLSQYKWFAASRNILHHFMSIQLFYSVKPMWNAYVDNNSLFIEDFNRGKTDMSRYTEDMQLWLTENNIQPGSENMYRELSKLILENEVLVENNESHYSSVLDIFLGQSAITRVFWGITLISAALCFAFTIFAVLRSMGDTRLKRPVGKVLHYFGKAMLTFLITPVFILAVIALVSMGFRQINLVLDAALAGTAAGQPVTTGTAIITSAITPESLINHSGATELTLDSYRQRLMNGSINWRDYAQFRMHFDSFKMYLVPVLAAGWFSLIMMISILFIFMRRVFDVILMYVSAPFFVSSMPLDGGAKFRAWREMFISKALMGFSSIITLKIALIFNQMLWAGGLRFSNYALLDIIFKLLFMMGGFYAAYKSHTMISGILNVGAAAAERETATFAQTYTTSVAGRALTAPGRFIKNQASGIAGEIFETDHRKLTLGIRNTAEKIADKTVNTASRAFGKDYHVRFSQETSVAQRRELKKYSRQAAADDFKRREAENILGNRKLKRDIKDEINELKGLRQKRLKELGLEKPLPPVPKKPSDKPLPPIPKPLPPIPKKTSDIPLPAIPRRQETNPNANNDD